MINVYLLIRLPYLIRLCNSRVLNTIRVSAVIGRFIGVASVVALRLACVALCEATKVNKLA